MADINRPFGEVRQILLKGAGGAGKTGLAIELAKALTGSRHSGDHGEGDKGTWDLEP